jgi:2-polyprenyl-6-methoxyphenol hydroxylase-like FAD-dependent oxidoreductase
MEPAQQRRASYRESAARVISRLIHRTVEIALDRPPEVAWSSRFRLNHRVVRTPRRGHILVVGDAAHVHSPAGGQGMNTGLQDSVSLAEALGATLQDGDDARLAALANTLAKLNTR